MTSKTARSGRVDILMRMEPGLKARVTKAANEDGMSVNDWLLDAIEEALALRDAEVAAGERKADLEQRLEMKFQEIVVSLAGGDITSLSARAQIKLQEKAEGALARWRDHTAIFYAEPRTLIERICRDYCGIETEIEGAQQTDTFGDEGLADDLDDGDEPEPDDDPGGE